MTKPPGSAPRFSPRLDGVEHHGRPLVLVDTYRGGRTDEPTRIVDNHAQHRWVIEIHDIHTVASSDVPEHG